MENKKSVAVWLISIEDKKILLQKRSASDNGKSQSFVGICQPTWNGIMEEDEDVMSAVKREAEEELGAEFAQAFDFSTLKLFDESEYFSNGKKYTGYSYWGVVNSTQLASVVLHGGAEPEFIKIGSAQEANQASGITLFDDQYQALKKLFSLKEIIEITS